uniref:Uncharacterized protein n=1 Tax=Metarhizium album TaxID=92629 RepID=A0A891GZ97_9HYPO|nr:hypothetical protein K8J96_mgp38 [Metarhizium album]QRK27466.1 hypothetical protein [Metarhizium album]
MTYLNFFRIIPLSIFIFFCLEGYLGKSVKRLVSKMNTIEFFLICALISGIFIIIFSFNIEVVYALDDEAIKKITEETKDVNVNTNISLNNPNINLPDSVFKGLTNVGIAGAIGAGMSSAAKVLKSSSLPPAVKIGVLAGTGIATGGIVTIANSLNSIMDKKINNAYAKERISSEIQPSISDLPKSGNDGPAAFSIEPSADLDTVMALLNANYILHWCVILFLYCILILFLANKVVNNQWKLEFLKKILGEKTQNFILKSLSLTSKTNNAFIILCFTFLIITSISTLYISYFITENIDIITDIVKESKKK